MARDAIAIFLNIDLDVFESGSSCCCRAICEAGTKVRGEAEILQREVARVSAEVATDLVRSAHPTVREVRLSLAPSGHRQPSRQPTGWITADADEQSWNGDVNIRA
jgi:hypothetical protein